MITIQRTNLLAGFVIYLTLSLFPIISSANHSWGNYHWARTSNPFTLKLGDNLTSSWDPYLSSTSYDWSISTVLDTVIVPGQTNSKNCRPSSGRVEVCNNKYGRNGWLGVAQVWVNGSHIVQGTVKLNDTYFNTSGYNDPAWRNLVLCQEIGHTFGLDHQDEDFYNSPLGTCMDYSSNPSPNQHPNAHDYEQLEIIYSHSDAISDVRPIPLANMDSFNRSSPSQWGHVIKSSKQRRTEIYELVLGSGQRLFTFVIWAE